MAATYSQTLCTTGVLSDFFFRCCQNVGILSSFLVISGAFCEEAVPRRAGFSKLLSTGTSGLMQNVVVTNSLLSTKFN